MMKKRRKTQPTKTLPKKSDTTKVDQTFGDHLAEIRKRLFAVGLFFLIGSVVAYYFRQPLLEIIMAPLNGQQLIYLTPGGGFTFIFQVVIYAGLILAAPVLVYQLHAFIRPALPERAQKSVIRLTALSTLLITGGISYGYFVAVPAAIKFLSNFAEGAIASNMTADSYLSFFLAYIGGLALLSLIPLVVIFWHWISPLTPGGLFRSEQWVVLLAFVAGAIITPTPDAFNQAMIAGPIIAVYQIGAISVLVSIYRARRAAKRAERSRTVKPAVPVVVPTAVAITPPAEPVVKPQPLMDRPQPKPVAAPKPGLYERQLTPPVRPTPRNHVIDGVNQAQRTVFHSSTRRARRTFERSNPMTQTERPLPRLSIDGFAR